MRLTDLQTPAIAQLAHEMSGERAQVRILGSRLDDRARGGVLDLIRALPEPSAIHVFLAARYSV